MIFPQLFCKHKWVTIRKHSFIVEKYFNAGPLTGYKPTGITQDKTYEFLSCEKCGKIKKLEY